jgi:hypothetical protein
MQSVGHTFKITPSIKKEIVKIIDERIREAHVTKEDFSELKSIVRDIGIKVGELTEAQKRTEIKVEELAEAQKRTEVKVEELAEAQKRTEVKVEELAEAQKRTEVKVEELAEAQKRTEEEVCKLAVGLNRTREDLGGLSRSFSYAFENEAYRMLPVVLKEKYAIKVRDKVIRADIGGKEINFFGKAEKDGREIYIVGEARVRLDDTKKREDVFNELEEKVEAVKEEYGEVEIAKLLVTHFATKGFLKKAEEKGVIVIQSFQW